MEKLYKLYSCMYKIILQVSCLTETLYCKTISDRRVAIDIGTSAIYQINLFRRPSP